MDKNVKMKRLSVAEQPKNQRYEMSIRFIADTVLKEMADFISKFGFNETPTMGNAMITRITQTINVIPDDNMLKKLAAALEGTENGALKLVNVRFDGYDYIHPVVPDSAGHDVSGHTVDVCLIRTDFNGNEPDLVDVITLPSDAVQGNDPVRAAESCIRRITSEYAKAQNITEPICPGDFLSIPSDILASYGVTVRPVDTALTLTLGMDVDLTEINC